MGRKSRNAKASQSVLLTSSTDSKDAPVLKDAELGVAPSKADYVLHDSAYPPSDSDTDGSVDVFLGTSVNGLLAKYDNLGSSHNRVWSADQQGDGDVVPIDEEKEKAIEEFLRSKAEGTKTQEQLFELEQKIGLAAERLEEVKANKRRVESEENAGRDPCLFSKRTAFDISIDAIDDKPGNNGSKHQ